MLGGVHIELTGEDVTACVGGARGLDRSETDLARLQIPSRSALNAEQKRWELAIVDRRRAGAGGGHGLARCCGPGALSPPGTITEFVKQPCKHLEGKDPRCRCHWLYGWSVLSCTARSELFLHPENQFVCGVYPHRC